MKPGYRADSIQIADNIQKIADNIQKITDDIQKIADNIQKIRLNFIEVVEQNYQQWKRKNEQVILVMDSFFTSLCGTFLQLLLCEIILSILAFAQ